jgi:nucleotide-binding universal stress UspA family protein
MNSPVSPSIALRNILFATDFSSCSEAALPYAITLARRYDSLLNIVSVVPAEICDDAKPPDPFYFRHSAENKMAKLVTSEVFQGVKHQGMVKEGAA